MSNFVINKLRGAKKEDTFLNSLHHEFENYPLKIETPLSSFFVISLAFSLIIDRRERLHTNGSATIESVLRSVYYVDETKTHIQTSLEIDAGTFIRLWISLPGISPKVRTSAIFVNDRLVSLPALNRRIAETSGEAKFLFVIINMPPELVDINVHPSKKTIIFDGMEEIINAIAMKASSAIESRMSNQVQSISQQLIIPKMFPSPSKIPKTQPL